MATHVASIKRLAELGDLRHPATGSVTPDAAAGSGQDGIADWRS